MRGRGASMNILSGLMYLGLSVALGGCIDEGGETDASDGDGASPTPATVERISFSGLVADGYLVDATVCLDLNDNKECDASEPTATSSTGGSFTITEATQAEVDAHALIVEVVPGTTTDEDKPNTPLTQKLTLSAPAGFSFVSPLSTMVQNEVEGGKDLTTAQTSVQEKLGTTLDLNEDYIAAQEDTSLSASDREEFEKLHQVAQVTAKVIADNIENLEDAAQQNNISLDDLLSTIVDQVFIALDDITVQVELIAADDNIDFNLETIADIAQEVDEELVNLNPDTIEQQVEQNKAEAGALPTSLAAVFKGEGISYFFTQRNQGSVSADYGNLRIDGDGNSIEENFRWDGGVFVENINDGFDDNVGYILTSNGWQAVPGGFNTLGTFVAKDDGSVDLVRADGLYIQRFNAIEVDLAGINAAVVMNSLDGGDGIWGEYLPSDLLFPAGSKGYEAVDNGSDEPYIVNDYSDCSSAERVGGLCNFTHVQQGAAATASNSNGPVATLAEIVVGLPFVPAGVAIDANNIKGAIIAYGEAGNVLAEVVSGGVVNYYVLGQAGINKLGSSSWSQLTMGGDTIYVLEPILPLNNYDSQFENARPILAVIEGFVRNGSHQVVLPAGDEGISVLNKVAKDVVVSAFSEVNYLPPLIMLEGMWGVYDLEEDPAPQFCFSFVDGVLTSMTKNLQGNIVSAPESFTLNGDTLMVQDLTWEFDGDTYTDTTFGVLTISPNDNCLSELAINIDKIASCDTGNTVWDGESETVVSSWNTPVDYDAAVTACQNTAPDFENTRTRLVGVQQTVLNDEDSEVTVSFNGDGSGRIEGPDARDFEWDVVDGRTIVTYHENILVADIIVTSSVILYEPELNYIELKQFYENSNVPGLGIIFSGRFEIEFPTPSTLADLVGVWEDFDDVENDGVVDDFAYMVITSAGEFFYYDYRNDELAINAGTAADCYVKYSATITDLGQGNFRTVGTFDGIVEDETDYIIVHDGVLYAEDDEDDDINPAASLTEDQFTPLCP